MDFPRPALVVLFGLGSGIADPCAAQTVPRLGLSGPEMRFDLSAKPLRRGRAAEPGADAVIRQPKGAGRSRTLAIGDETGMEARQAAEGEWPVDLRQWAPTPRSALAGP